MSFSEKVVQLRITSATVIDGLIVRAGQLVEMVEGEAKSLLRLGKAELHGAAAETDASNAAAQQSDADLNAAAAQAAADVAKRAKPADTKGR